MHYRIQEGGFDLPDTLHDRTVNIFTATADGPSPFNLVITRSESATIFLAAHVKAEIDLMTQTLAGFEFLWERQHQIGGRPAVIVAAKIDGPNGPMEQRQIFCLPEGRKSLTVTATASPAFDQEQLGFLNSFAASFTFDA